MNASVRAPSDRAADDFYVTPRSATRNEEIISEADIADLPPHVLEQGEQP